jgi:hypothetical protein
VILTQKQNTRKIQIILYPVHKIKIHQHGILVL